MSLSWVGLENALSGAILPVTGKGRQAERVPIYCPAKVWYGTEGQDRRVISGYVLNLSTYGVMVESRGPLVVGARVLLHSNELITGVAIVRHSTRKLWRYRIGLQFERNLQSRLSIE